MNKTNNSIIKKFKFKYVILPLVMMILLLIDQYSKYLVRIYMNENKRYHVIKLLLNLEYVENRGVAFGLFSGKKLIISISVLVVTLIIFYGIIYIERLIRQLEADSFENNNSPFTDNNNSFKRSILIRKLVLLQILGTFLIAGSIGNLIDRIRFGYVVDFIQFDFINFPVFNIADCYVTISVFVLLFMILFFLSDEEINLLQLRK